MIARAKILKVENISGDAKATGKPYNLDFLHILDTDNFDKIKLMIPKDQVTILASFVGKDGTIHLGVDPKTEKLQFVSWKAAA